MSALQPLEQSLWHSIRAPSLQLIITAATVSYTRAAASWGNEGADSLAMPVRQPSAIDFDVRPASFLFPRQIRDKGWLPGLAAVSRVGLLDPMGIRGYIGPDESNENGPPVICLLSIELTSTVLEFPDQRWAQCAIVHVGGRLAPLMVFGVVEEERCSFEVGSGVIKLFQISKAVPDLTDGDFSIRFDPFLGTGGRVEKELNVDAPVAEVKIKIVLSVVLMRGSNLRLRGG